MYFPSAEDGSLHPFLGAWLISIVLTLVGLVATVRASKPNRVQSLGVVWHDLVMWCIANDLALTLGCKLWLDGILPK